MNPEATWGHIFHFYARAGACIASGVLALVLFYNALVGMAEDAPTWWVWMFCTGTVALLVNAHYAEKAAREIAEEVSWEI